MVIITGLNIWAIPQPTTQVKKNESVAQQVKVLAEDLSSIPGTHLAEGENSLP